VYGIIGILTYRSYSSPAVTYGYEALAIAALGELGPHFTVPYTTDLLSAVRR
jgi:hypothetical protein